LTGGRAGGLRSKGAEESPEMLAFTEAARLDNRGTPPISETGEEK
jgi:hypothetical protein